MSAIEPWLLAIIAKQAGVAHRFYRMAERPAHLAAMFPEEFHG